METEATEAQYVTFAEITRETGLTPRKINYRVAADRIPVYVSAEDRRKRMIAVNDLARLVEIREVRPASRRDRTAA